MRAREGGNGGSLSCCRGLGEEEGAVEHFCGPLAGGR